MSKTSSYKLLGFLTTLNILNFIDRQLLSSFSNFIVPDLNLTNTQFGLLSGLAFIVFYSLMGLFMGAIADRVHRPKFISFGVLLWSLLTAISGMAKNFWMLLLPRIFIGIGESILTPSALSLLSDHFPRKNMGFVSGFYYLAVPLGVTASFYIAGYLGPLWGWRNCFYALGAIGIVLGIAMLFFQETPKRKHQLETQLTKDVLNKKVIKESITALRQTLKENYALRLTIYGGIGSDYYTKITGKGRQIFLFWCLLAFTPFMIFYRLTDDTGIVFFSIMFLGFFQWGCLYGPITSSIQEMAPEKMRAVVLAYYLLMVNIVGLGIGITMAGVMIDYLLSNGIEEAYSKTMLTFQLLAGLCLPAFYIAGKNYKPID